ncbi:hypothetical protein FOIG_02280 [Fusarium odoratissimum NRRL 54006]|uniref:Uncharacterized protein n=1 Tax=Fusarium odoratissimum (strain NRRL 54006) TaxID=1089451 RepID=X0K7P4_FUSO5|nr:uncharacterized protein FOIG_02280 [Fusarium odoratissimum NRRL 54006]EXM09473.1 hypothetical protein FOIG_02280 [Fusarium odoratissimum NRRL 54006]
MGMGTKILVELDGDLQGLNLKVKGGVCYQCRGLLVDQVLLCKDKKSPSREPLAVMPTLFLPVHSSNGLLPSQASGVCRPTGSVLGSVAVFRTPSAPRRSHHDRENNKTQPEAEAAEEEKETVGDDRNVTRW